ncbi:MAG TPA: PH domain-containing protein [bacterium]|jgi:uncharacterized membrane protein YdbT with pleckstrin-like domain
MGYIEQSLAANETVVYKGKLSPYIFSSSLLFALLWIWAILVRVQPLIFFCGLLTLLSLISNAIRLRSAEFAVTTRRVVLKDGFLRRRTIEILLSKVEGAHVNQGIFGRMFNYGKLTVVGSGGTQQPFTKVEAPLTFRARMQDQIIIAEQREVITK